MKKNLKSLMEEKVELNKKRNEIATKYLSIDTRIQTLNQMLERNTSPENEKTIRNKIEEANCDLWRVRRMLTDNRKERDQVLKKIKSKLDNFRTSQNNLFTHSKPDLPPH